MYRRNIYNCQNIVTPWASDGVDNEKTDSDVGFSIGEVFMIHEGQIFCFIIFILAKLFSSVQKKNEERGNTIDINTYDKR